MPGSVQDGRGFGVHIFQSNALLAIHGFVPKSVDDPEGPTTGCYHITTPQTQPDSHRPSLITAEDAANPETGSIEVSVAILSVDTGVKQA
jgi:hypothetical protein